MLFAVSAVRKHTLLPRHLFIFIIPAFFANSAVFLILNPSLSLPTQPIRLCLPCFDEQNTAITLSILRLLEFPQRPQLLQLHLDLSDVVRPSHSCESGRVTDNHRTCQHRLLVLSSNALSNPILPTPPAYNSHSQLLRVGRLMLGTIKFPFSKAVSNSSIVIPGRSPCYS